MKNKLASAMILITSLAVAGTISSVIASALVIALGVALVGGMQIAHRLFPNESLQKIEDTSYKPTLLGYNDSLLEKLAVYYLLSPKNELAGHIKDIINHASQITNFQEKNDGVISEIVVSYKGFLDEYTRKALSIVEKYLQAQQYLASCNQEAISQEIAEMRATIQNGDKSLKKTLLEKERTLEEIMKMKSSQSLSVQELREIDATLEALLATIVSAQTNNLDGQSFRDELQRTISSTSQAIKETLC